MTRAAHLLWLVALWIALWGQLTVANVASGLAVGAVVMLAFRNHQVGYVVVRPLRMLHFALYFLYKLVESTIIVAREILAPRSRIRQGIVAVPLGGCSDAVATLIADAISLTPGTLTLEVRNDDVTTLYVHVLHLHDVEAVRRDIRRLEVLAVRAFGTRDAIAGLTEDDSYTIEEHT